MPTSDRSEVAWITRWPSRSIMLCKRRRRWRGIHEQGDRQRADRLHPGVRVAGGAAVPAALAGNALLDRRDAGRSGCARLVGLRPVWFRADARARDGRTRTAATAALALQWRRGRQV